MGTAELVGSMGLTFFCNRCVEVLYRFDKGENVSSELEETCKKAITAFKSLKWPLEKDAIGGEKVGLFNTNEEIRSFEETLAAKSKTAPTEVLDHLINDLEIMVAAKPAEEKKQTARQLRSFFDTLGNYSFCATRESLRIH